MNGRGFLLIVVGGLVLGAMVGGAFVAGLIAGGGSDDEEAAPNVLTLPPPAGSEPSTTEPAAPPEDIQNLGQIFQRIQSGEMTQEEAAQLRQMFQGGGFGGAGGRPGAGLAGGVLGGTVESVEDGKIVVNTPQGSLEVNIVPETVIQRTEVSTLTAGELREGLQVQIVGQPGETGAVDAASIFVVPEGAAGFGGRGIGGSRPGLGGGQ